MIPDGFPVELSMSFPFNRRAFFGEIKLLHVLKRDLEFFTNWGTEFLCTLK